MKKHFLLFTLLWVNLIAFNQNLGLQWAGSIDENFFPGFNKISILDNNDNLLVVGNFIGTVDFDISPTSSYNLTASGTSYDIFIAKYSSNGNLLWAKRIGDDNGLEESGYSVVIDDFNNVIVTGFFAGIVDFDPSSTNVSNLVSTWDASFLLKLNSNGDFLWAQKIAEQDQMGWDFGIHVSIDNSNNIYVVGDFQASNDFDNGPGTAVLSTIGLAIDTYILKKDQNGGFLWVKQLQCQYTDIVNRVRDIAVDNSGDIYLTGNFNGAVDFDPGSGTQLFSTAQYGSNGQFIYDAFLTKLSSNGNFVWAKSYGTLNGMEKGMSLFIDNNNDIIFTGNFNDNIDISGNSTLSFITNGSNDFFLAKINATGTMIWAKQFGGTGSDGANVVTVGNNNDIYLSGGYNNSIDIDPSAGIYNLNCTSSSAFLLKLTNNANFIFAKDYQTNTVSCASLNIDSQENIFLCGGISGVTDMDFTTAYFPISNISSPVNSDCFIAKYCQFTGIPPQITLNQPLGCVSDAVLTSNYATNNLWSTNSTNQTISVNAAGNYTLTVTDVNGCTMKDMITVAVPTDPNPPQVSAGLDQILCSGSSTTLAASGASTYSWSNGLGTSPTPSVSPTANTTYTVTGTSVNGCVSTDQVLVAVQNCGACFNPATTTQIGNNGTLNGTFSASTTPTASIMM